MKPWNVLAATLCIGLVALLSTGTLQAQHDPGPRAGTPVVGGPYPTLNAAEQAIFVNGLGQFTEVNDSVPRVNGNGGLGPGLTPMVAPLVILSQSRLEQVPVQLARKCRNRILRLLLDYLAGARKHYPIVYYAETAQYEKLRFVRYSDGTLDGGVHDLFSIAGRTDAPGCNLPQPNFAAQLNANNVDL